MSKKAKFILPFVIIIVVTCISSVKTLSLIDGYGRLINYVGIVRGASQRVIKLETNGMPNDELISYLDDILHELLTGEGHYNLARTDAKAFNSQLEQLSKEWKSVKAEIIEVRGGKDKKELLRSSEELFTIANNAVFAIEGYSAENSGMLVKRLAIVAAISLILGVFVLAYYVKKYFQLRKKTEVLEEKAGEDALTGALNGERFYNKVEKYINTHPGEKIALQYIDIENFKYINDVFGYEYGDRILKKYAECMSASLERDELFCRLEADHFLAMRLYTSKEQLLEMQQSIDKEFLNQDILPGKHNIIIVCGFCCTEDTEEELDARALANRANYAHKTIKNSSGKGYAFYDEGIRKKMFKEVHISDQLEGALLNREFIVYLQPKVAPIDNKIMSAEALVRWKNTSGEWYLPGDFIPILEKRHLIGLLDQYVFEEVCRFLSWRDKKGLSNVPISVNVSKTRFYSTDFVKEYTDIKEYYNIPDGMLEIEITETVACENLEYMSEVVNELHKSGFLCSMDDFGTGYSSLSMLKGMEIDILKMDALFFQAGKGTKKERTIVHGILRMIKELDMQTVAEGIETEEQVRFLKECGCDLIQGYYYYKPMPMEQFEKELENNRTN